ncbi:MAG TPA: hypothetical protein VG389_13140 [Myxococcota bacterium]|jgi:hypothetical protein|nr:hypothetical protein [Myxococcota bacterium]
MFQEILARVILFAGLALGFALGGLLLAKRSSASQALMAATLVSGVNVLMELVKGVVGEGMVYSIACVPLYGAVTWLVYRGLYELEGGKGIALAVIAVLVAVGVLFLATLVLGPGLIFALV